MYKKLRKEVKKVCSLIILRYKDKSSITGACCKDKIFIIGPQLCHWEYSLTLLHEMGHWILKHNINLNHYLKYRKKCEMDAWITGLKWAMQYGFKITPAVINCAATSTKEVYHIKDKTFQLFKKRIKDLSLTMSSCSL